MRRIGRWSKTAAGYTASGGAGIATLVHPSALMVTVSVLLVVVTALTDPRVLGTLALAWCVVRGKNPGPAGKLLVEHAKVITQQRDQ